MTPESQSDSEQRSPEEIQAEIDATREELGDTVAAVADKADVKKQAKAKVSGAKESFGAKAGDAVPESAAAGAQQVQQFAKDNPVPLAIAGAFIAGFAVAKLHSR